MYGYIYIDIDTHIHVHIWIAVIISGGQQRDFGDDVHTAVNFPLTIADK